MKTKTQRKVKTPEGLKFKMTEKHMDEFVPSKGNKLFTITICESYSGQALTFFVLGDDEKSAAKNYLTYFKWSKRDMMEDYENVGWIYATPKQIEHHEYEDSWGNGTFNVLYVGQISK